MDKPYIHTYCVYKISQKKLSQTALAAMCGCSVAAINQILTGKKSSSRIQAKIAQYLGHSSWLELVASAAEFAKYISNIDKHLKDCKERRIV
jgi:transcriptional regulator with XRE-family HTH domain